jgi:hypothetical protein
VTEASCNAIETRMVGRVASRKKHLTKPGVVIVGRVVNI